jgi:hypothetical protein
MSETMRRSFFKTHYHPIRFEGVKHFKKWMKRLLKWSWNYPRRS